MIVVYHSSNVYVSAAAVSMVSIMENNKSMDDITFYLIEHGITAENQQKIKALVEGYGRKVVFIPIPDMQTEYNLTIAHVKNRWILDSYIRMFLGTLLDNGIKRVLYLDCDTLCDGNLEELWNVELGDSITAGVIDCISEPYYNFFHLSENARYCNSGMMLIDLEKWRQEKTEDKVRDYVNKRKGYVFFMEQSVMNIVLDGRIKIVHPKFNTYTLMPVFGYKNLQRLRHCQRFYTEKEMEEAVQNPHLIHFTNLFYIKFRPWVKGCNHPYKELYLKYRAMTPWKDEELQEGNMPLSKKILHRLMRLTPLPILAWTVGLVYNELRPKMIKRQEDDFFKTHEE